MSTITLLLDASGLPLKHEVPLFEPILEVLIALEDKPEVTILLLHNAEDTLRLKPLPFQVLRQLDFLEVGPDFPTDQLIARLRSSPTDAVAQLPASEGLSAKMFQAFSSLPRPGCLRFLLPELRLFHFASVSQHLPVSGWMARWELAEEIISSRKTAEDLHLFPLVQDLHHLHPHVQWESVSLTTDYVKKRDFHSPPLLRASSRILAILPHYRCEEWLPHVLENLTRQTRPPDHILVVDDHSGQPPREIVESFPGVTLFSTLENLGPEAIMHQVMLQTDFGGYMFHDADDWSAIDRLEEQLALAEESGAGLVGAQELQILLQKSCFLATTFPLQISQAMGATTGHYTINGSNLLARSLVQAIGGLDASFRLSADTDLVYRASLAGLAVNLPRFGYLRRIRQGSLTSDPATNLNSVRRRMELIVMNERAQKNQLRLRRHIPLHLLPKRVAPILPLRHELGPALPLVKS